MNLCVAIFNIEMEENKWHFRHIMLYYFKKGKNAVETHTKRFVQCMEKELWLIKHVKIGLWSFVLEISHWMMLHGQADQLKLIEIKSRH